ncbi:MAG: hypothetical protein JJE40_18615 [Vicinamibacteria bacterium]|nr:hypothetical protein [Vicinamibacteria bacterium]
MTRARVALALLNLGGGLMILGAGYDLLLDAPPLFWAELLGQPLSNLPPAVARLLMALVHALGGTLLAAGVVVLLLVNGPVRRGDQTTALAVLVLVCVGEGGNGLQMIRAGGSYGWGALAMIVPAIVGLLLAYVPSPAFGVSNSGPRR